MKRLLTFVLATVTLAMASCAKQAELRVATFNIRYDSAPDATTGDSWEERKGGVKGLNIRTYNPL